MADCYVVKTFISSNMSDVHREFSQNKCLIPTTLQTNVNVDSREVLELIGFGCATETPCATAMCGCYNAHLSCTIFCGCHREAHCQNEHTQWDDNFFRVTEKVYKILERVKF